MTTTNGQANSSSFALLPVGQNIFHIWIRAFGHMALNVLVIVAITLLILRWSLAGPVARMGQWMRALRAGRHAVPSASDLLVSSDRSRRNRATLGTCRRPARLHRAGSQDCKCCESLWTAERLMKPGPQSTRAAATFLRRLEPRALHPPTTRQGDYGVRPGQRRSHRHRAHTLRLQRNLGGPRKRRRGPRNSR